MSVAKRHGVYALQTAWQPPSGVAEDRNYIDGYAYTAAVLDYDKMYRPLAEASTIPSSE